MNILLWIRINLSYLRETTLYWIPTKTPALKNAGLCIDDIQNLMDLKINFWWAVSVCVFPLFQVTQRIIQYHWIFLEYRKSSFFSSVPDEGKGGLFMIKIKGAKSNIKKDVGISTLFFDSNEIEKEIGIFFR